MLGFGVLGFVLREMGYPMAPLVLGIVLGDLLDKNFRRGAGAVRRRRSTPFFTRPISARAGAADASRCYCGASRRCAALRGAALFGSRTDEAVACATRCCAELPFARQCALAADARLRRRWRSRRSRWRADPTHADAAAHRRACAQALRDDGLVISGLHWLLVAPQGLSITAPTPRCARDTVDVMQRAVRAVPPSWAAAYLVHGSPDAAPAAARADRAVSRATARVECLRRGGRGRARRCGVTYCIEPLSPRETDFVNTVAEAVALVEAIDNPALKTMIDCSAAGTGRKATCRALMRALAAQRPHRATCRSTTRTGAAPAQGEMAFAPILRGAAQTQQALRRHASRSSPSTTCPTARPARRAPSATCAASDGAAPHDRRAPPAAARDRRCSSGR